MAAGLLASATLIAAGTAQADTLVSNLDQTGGSFPATLTIYDHALAFTTGNNSAGYTLTGVKVVASEYAALSEVVTINASNNGNPGAVQGTLTRDFDTESGLYSHTGLALAANTTYFVFFDVSSGEGVLNAILSDGQTGKSGWTIANGGLYRNRAGGNWLTWLYSLKMRIDGTVTQATDSMPSFGETIANQSYTQNTRITDLTLPAATGGDGTVSYTLTGPGGGALPDGLTFTASTRVLSGTPARSQAAATYTYTATDSDATDPDSASLTFTIAIAADPNDSSPAFAADASISNQSLPQHWAVDLTLPAATGGDGTLNYTLTKSDGSALPAGLTFTASTRKLTGAPTTVQTASDYVYKVTDSDAARPDSAELAFTIAVTANAVPSFGMSAIANQSYTQNAQITDLTLPEATGGDGTLQYELVGTLPAGLTYSSTNRRISGTPTATQAATSYTWRATDNNGDKVELTFSIAVAVQDLMPSFGDTIANRSFKQNRPIDDLVLPQATGGDGTLNYTLTGPSGGSLPAGLTFTAATRTLSGTPTATQAATTYTYTVTDSDAANPDSAELTFTIAVTANQVPTLSGTVLVQTYAKGVRITDLVLPQATGGDGALVYSLSPTPPAGLTFTAGTRTLAGTPTAASAVTTYTYTVTDSDATDPDTDELTFTVEVRGVTVSKSAVTVAEADDSATSPAKENEAAYTVVLDVDPGLETTVTVTPSVPSGAAVTFSPSSLEFIGGNIDGNWSTPQTVTVTAVDDDFDNAGDMRTATISHAVSGYSPVTAAASVTATVTDDDALTGLSVSAVSGESTKLSVSWDAYGGAEEYLVKWKTGGGDFNAGQEATSSPYTIDGLTASTAYTVEVSAIDTGTGSDVVLGKAEGTGTTNTPTNNAPVFDPTSYGFSLAENADGSGTAVNLGTVSATDSDTGDTIAYSITAGNTDGKFAVSSSGAVTYTGGGENYEAFATPAAAYSLTVRASDGTAHAEATVTVAVTDVAEKPGTPAAPTVTAKTNDSLTVRWTAPANTGPGITGYDLQYKSAAVDWMDGPQDQTGLTATVGGLEPGTQYLVRVRASSDEGDGDWSGSASDVTRDAQPQQAAPTVRLSASPNPVAEGSSVTVTATLSAALTNDATIPLTLTNGTAEGGDYTAPASIAITGGQTSGTGRIATVDDTDADDETFTVALGTLPAEVTAGTPASVTVTITDGDGSTGNTGDGNTGNIGDIDTGSGTEPEPAPEPPAPSTDASLAGLTGHASADGREFGAELALVPDFAAETTGYAVTVSHETLHARLTPTVNDAKAMVTMGPQGDTPADAASGEPGPAFALAVGENVIGITVTAEDETTTRTYTVTILREAAVLDEAADRAHLFPLFADGEGFRTHLFLTNVSHPGNRCTLALHGAGLDAARFEAHAALTADAETEAGIQIDLGDTGADTVLTTAGERELKIGYAKLACTHPAVARMLLVQESGGATTAMTTLERAHEAHTFRFPVLPHLGRLGIVFANDNALDAACAVEVETADGTGVGGGNLGVPARSAVPRFLDEIVPETADADIGAAGAAAVTCDRPVAALGVVLHGGDFAALAAVAPDAAAETEAETENAGREDAGPEDGGEAPQSHRLLPLVMDGGGFRSRLVVTNLSEAANRCAMRMRLPGIPAAKFESAAGVTWEDSSRAALELAGPGSRIALPSLNRSPFVSFGHAVLDCDAPVGVSNLLTADAPDGPAGVAAVAPVRAAREIRFPVPPRLESFALALTDAGEAGAACAATLTPAGRAEAPAAETPIEIPAGSTAMRFLEDLFQTPEDFAGGTLQLRCDNDIAAVALPAANAAFTAFPPLVPAFDLAPAPADEEPD